MILRCSILLALLVLMGKTPAQAQPDVPTGLTATGGDQMVSLSWNASAGADYYRVYRATSSYPYFSIGYVYETSLQDYGDFDEYSNDPLINGVTCYYVVTAVNMLGESGYSNEASATPVAPPPPSAPTGLVATAGNGTVVLTWNASPGATMYWVRRGTTSGGPYTTITNEYAPTFHENNLTNGTTYYYVVSAVNNGGESPNSNEASASPQGPPPPSPPTDLTAAASGKRKVNLQWTQSSSPGISENRIYRSTTNGGPYTLIAVRSPGTAYTDTSVTSKTTYYYRVTVVDSNGLESPYSNQASATSR